MCNIQKLNSLDVMHYWFKLKCSAHITLCGISYSMPVHFLLYAENSKLSSFWGSWTHVKCHQMKLYAAFSKWITVKGGNMKQLPHWPHPISTIEHTYNTCELCLHCAKSRPGSAISREMTHL